jgi:hypothetical protein
MGCSREGCEQRAYIACEMQENLFAYQELSGCALRDWGMSVLRPDSDPADCRLGS